MAFVLKQSATFEWPLKIVIPTDGGKKATFTLDVEFRRLAQSRLTEVLNIARAAMRGETVDSAEDEDIARELVCGWKGVVDDDGQEIPFSEAALTQMVELPFVAGQIIRQFYEAHNSEKKPGKRGN